MKRRSIWSLFAVVVLAAACGGERLVAPRVGDVEAHFVAGGISVTNRTGGKLYYAAVNPRALLLWGRCKDPATCPAIAPHAIEVVPFANILGGGEGLEDAVVYFWRLRVKGDDIEATEAQSLNVVR